METNTITTYTTNIMPTNTIDIDTAGFPQLPDGYTSWLYLGKAVHKKYKAPWVYRATLSPTWGVIKSNNQALSGFDGEYLEAIPAPCIGDPLTVDDMKLNASEREYARWWTHRSASAKQHQAVQRFLDNTIGTTTSIRATYYSDTEALVLTKDTYYRCQTMRYARAFSLANSTTVDAELRDFTRQLDTVISGAPNVEVSWSTVNNTYCTPMAGYDMDDSDEPESITGSCMEKFCDENYDDIGHDVFDVYFRLERLGHLKMIRIKIDDEYVGRAICWKPDLSQNTWIMDRIYCRMDRGCMPDEVITSVEEFAAANSITRRFHKCRAHALRSITPSRFDVTGLSEFEYYPFFDSYAGVSSRGVEDDAGYCSIVCDSPSGGYSSGNDDDHADENSDDDDENYVLPVFMPSPVRFTVIGRSDPYLLSEIVFSDFHAMYVHTDDAVTLYDGRIVHRTWAVELKGTGCTMYALAQEAVGVRWFNADGTTETFWALRNSAYEMRVSTVRTNSLTLPSLSSLVDAGVVTRSITATPPLQIPPHLPPFPPARGGMMWVYRGESVVVQEDYIYWIMDSGYGWRNNPAPSMGSANTHYATLAPIPAPPVDEYIDRIPPFPPTPTPNHHWVYRGTGADIAGVYASISTTEIHSPLAYWSIGSRSNRVRHAIYLELVPDTHA
jgi:hypothetical protein